ncbi:MAG: bacteriohemerythrin [Planctomycetes bacterium]|nr:bacteriohemerythrin [Planctomycetota bacterium]
MAFFEWEDRFRVGVDEIDRQHQRLIGLINELHAAITRSDELATMAAVLAEMDAITSALAELIRYTEYHFSTEEGLMVECAYPECDDHRHAHQQFIEKVQGYQQQFEKKKTRLSVDLIDFLVQWWRAHIQDSDKRCGAYVISRRSR